MSEAARTFDGDSFQKFVLDQEIIGFFDEPIRLKSGRMSSWYVNWRRATDDAFTLEQLVPFVLGYIRQNQIPCDTIYGVPEGATKLGVLCAMAWARGSTNFSKGSHAVAMGRAQPKEHGDPADRHFVGFPRGKVVVLEDTTTTGGALVSELQRLEASGVQVSAAIGLTNRMERRADGKSVAEAVQSDFDGRIPYYSLSEGPSLLRKLTQRKTIASEVREALVREFAEFGVAPLELE